MTNSQLRKHERKRGHPPDLGALLASSQASPAALHDFYSATAPHLASALSATNNEGLAEQVLVRTYQQVWRRPTCELIFLTNNADVLSWLLRIALVELAKSRSIVAKDSEQKSQQDDWS